LDLLEGNIGSAKCAHYQIAPTRNKAKHAIIQTPRKDSRRQQSNIVFRQGNMVNKVYELRR
jgi:hypothetical protein